MSDKMCHTYKSVRFFKSEIPEGIGPLKPLPWIVLISRFIQL
ncbi:hypothetical protein MtrunA17_Chr8g0359661 [Medicago truncatula]|uniref:Uncharacterized protein n=1 Tax=Medicago truncatula TaxID=3880 RepID=A0A396GK05_MEDTR|nr:hypothetical protein MtrunA17_Chr8g0359661 [Medicago truncatula]